MRAHRACPSPPPAERSRRARRKIDAPDVVDRMVQLIDTGLSGPISITAIASAIGYDATVLGVLFRRRTGITARRFIAVRRVTRAAEWIRQGVKIEAVALEVGYRSKKNFYRQFRRHFGTTPGVYRARFAKSDVTAG
jgi:methylphosphotriester-DNA--protein-cysteine methyltransferase